MGYILAIHVPIAGATILPVLLNWPLILLPIHIAFLELIIDPASSIAFEAEPADPNVMDRPPRRPAAPLFTRSQLSVHLLQGVIVLAIVMALYVAASASGQSDNQARTVAFAALVLANISLILSDRSWTEGFIRSLQRPNRALWYIVGGAIVFLAAALYVPALQALFQFAPLAAPWLAASIAAGALSLVCVEGLEIALSRTRRT